MSKEVKNKLFDQNIFDSAIFDLSESPSYITGIYHARKITEQEARSKEQEICKNEWNEPHIIEEGSGRVFVGKREDLPEGGVRGRIYIATDEGNIYFDDGNKWIDLRGTWETLIGPPNGACPLDSAGQISDCYLPRILFGKTCPKDKEVTCLIKADGSGDYSTIQDALDAGVKHIWLEPNSTFQVGDLTFKYDGQQLHGNYSTLDFSSGTALINFNGKNNLVIEDLYFNMGRIVNASWFTGSTSYSIIKNITTSITSGYLQYFEGSYYNCLLSNISFTSRTTALRPTFSKCTLINVIFNHVFPMIANIKVGNWADSVFIGLTSCTNYPDYPPLQIESSTALIRNCVFINPRLVASLSADGMDLSNAAANSVQNTVIIGYNCIKSSSPPTTKDLKLGGSGNYIYLIGEPASNRDAYEVTGGAVIYRAFSSNYENLDANWFRLNNLVFSKTTDISASSDKIGAIWFNPNDRTFRTIIDASTIKTLQTNTVKVYQANRVPDYKITTYQVRILAINDGGTIKYKPQHYVNGQWVDLWDNSYLEDAPEVTPYWGG